MNQQCILKGVLEGAQRMYPKIEPYLLEADKVVKSKIYPKIEPYLLEVDKSYKVVKTKIYPKIEPYLLKFDEVMCKCLPTKVTEKTKDPVTDPTSQLAKAAPAVKTSAAKSVRSAPSPIAVAVIAGKDRAGSPTNEKWARSIGIYEFFPKTKHGQIDTFLSFKLTGILLSIWS